MATYKLGFEPKMYIGTAGSAPSTELKTVKDVEVNLSSGEVDVTARASGAFKVYIPGMIDLSISFNILADSSNDNLATIRSAYFGRTAISVKIELGDGYAFQSDAIITEFNNSQSTEGAVTYAVTLKPTITSDSFLPQIAAVSSSSASSN